MVESDLAKRLLNQREKSGLSQAEVARRVGIDNSSLSRIESGTRKVSSDELDKFASIYGVTTDYLLNRNSTPSWATPKQVTDLKKMLENPDEMDEGFSFGDDSLTEDEKNMLKMAFSQIFWKRMNLKRMPMKPSEGDDKK